MVVVGVNALRDCLAFRAREGLVVGMNALRLTFRVSAEGGVGGGHECPPSRISSKGGFGGGHKCPLSRDWSKGWGMMGMYALWHLSNRETGGWWWV